MIRIFLYLQLTSLKNMVWQRVSRLRQPKYLLGAVAGAAYFYFIIFGRAFARPRSAPALPGGNGDEMMTLVSQFAGPMLFVVVLAAWLFGNSRAALQFSEAETAFLFPAPVARRTLVHFKLVRAQFGILFSALFMTLLVRRGGSSGHTLFHAVGWWLVFSTLSLHLIGASFARQRLLDFGWGPWRRRLLIGGGLLALAAAGWFVVRSAANAPGPAELDGFGALMHYTGEMFGRPPIAWVLAPFRWMVQPYFARDGAAFALALGPALLLLAAHYLWVIRSDVAFEEASIELAARRARLVANARAGRWNTGQEAPTKPRPEPFPLRVPGRAPIAFLWKNLVALGPLYRMRSWLIACAALAGLVGWLAADRERADYLVMVMIFSAFLSVALLLGGPMFMRREVQQTLTHLDITKAYPLAGWQIVIGQLLTPMVVTTFLEWFLLFGIVLSAAAMKHQFAVMAMVGAGGLGCLGLVVPPLCGLLLCLPYAGVLYFPAWGLASSSPGGGGFEVLGQRLVFFAGYFLVLVVAILPAAAVGGIVFFIANALIGRLTAFTLTTLVVSVVLAAELGGAVWWLGEKLDRFDLSQEAPR